MIFYFLFVFFFFKYMLLRIEKLPDLEGPYLNLRMIELLS